MYRVWYKPASVRDSVCSKYPCISLNQHWFVCTNYNSHHAWPLWEWKAVQRPEQILKVWRKTLFLPRTQYSQYVYTGELGYDGPLYDRFLHMTDDMLGPSPMHIMYSSYVYDGFCIWRTNFPGPIESVISKFTCITVSVISRTVCFLIAPVISNQYKMAQIGVCKQNNSQAILN